MKSYSTYLSECFHLAVILSSSMRVVTDDEIVFFFVAERPRLGVCVCVSVCEHFHLLMGTWVASVSWLL